MPKKNLFKNHDRKKFIIYGFSFARYADDNIYNEIKKTFDEFYDVSEKSDFSVLQIIKELNLDIAVDMMGYTKRSRSYLFDKRIAPTQVSFLGYLGTMGNTAYDYIVADKFTIPSNNEEYYDENVLRLPVYQPNNYKEISFKTVSKNSLGLPMNSFIYCCFNNPYKITPFIFDAWIKILQSTNNTYLYLIKSNNYSQENIKNYIFKKDLEPNRIIFTEKVSYDRYLSMLNACDVFLDTSPYNAGATAIDCLAVNTPIISLTGNSYVSRMCGSILNNLNQSDLIADNVTQQSIVQAITQKKLEVQALIDKVHLGIFENDTADSNAKEFEAQVNKILNKAMDESGKIARSSLSSTNRFMMIVESGAKGNMLNITQMISGLGQQNVDGKRIPYGYDNRTLPHFSRYDDSPEARGFVVNSYIEGLNAFELFHHAQGGRVGLIDTACKTSVTGYIQRRLIKHLEDVKVAYDMTVRNNKNKIVQYSYGDDGIETTRVENQPIPLVGLSTEDILVAIFGI